MADQPIHPGETVAPELRQALLTLFEYFVPFGEDEDGWITRYIVPSGPVHRLIGAAQGAGIPAAFRAIGKERTDWYEDPEFRHDMEMATARARHRLHQQQAALIDGSSDA